MELGAKNEIQYKEILEKDKGTMKWEIKLSKKTKAEKDQVQDNVTQKQLKQLQERIQKSRNPDGPLTYQSYKEII